MSTAGLTVSPVRAWVMASRPKTLLAAVAPVAVGAGLALGRGVFSAGPAVGALVGAVLIQIGTNLANDYYDHAHGGDTAERVGPLRVTQAGLLDPEVVRTGMLVVFAGALVVGAYLTYVAGWPVVVIGLASIAAGIAYTAGPFPLAYHGLGEVFVFVFFGLVAVGGTYWVQAGAFPPDLLLAGAGIGALDTAILVANNLRDLPTDERAGKRTLAVRLGVVGSQIEYTLLLASAFAVPVLGVQMLGWPLWSCLSLAAGVPALAPLRRVVSLGGEPHELTPALAQTAAVTGLYGLLLAGALAWG